MNSTRLLLSAILAALIATPVLADPQARPSAAPGPAQTAASSRPAPPLTRQVAPWWLAEPVSASLGSAERELPVNRARFSVTYRALGKTAAEATQKALARTDPLVGALATLGADKVRIETTISIDPIYQTYKDKNGRVVANRRADKIESYNAQVILALEVTDLGVFRQVMTAAVASQPAELGRTVYDLEPDEGVQASLLEEALADATRRARDGMEATGGRLGAVRLVDLSSRACRAESLLAVGGTPRGVEQIVATGSFLRGAAEDAALPVEVTTRDELVAQGDPTVASLVRVMSDLQAASYALPFTPPRRTLAAQVCVIYELR